MPEPEADDIVFVPPTGLTQQIEDAFNEHLMGLDEWEMPDDTDAALAAFAKTWRAAP